MGKFQVPRIPVPTEDGKTKEIPLTIQRAHEIIAKKAREDIGVFFQFMNGKVPGMPQKEWFENVLNYDKVMINCPRGFGKTSWAIPTLAWFMGHNPESSNVIVAVSGEVAKQRLSVLRNYVDYNPRYKLVFPWIESDPRKPWKQTGINILDTRDTYSVFMQRRTNLGVDITHSLLAASPDMNTLIGNRISGIALIDDLHDNNHINSPGLRAKAIDFYESTYINCLIPGAKSIIIGTRWAADDIIGYIRERIPLGGNYGYRDINTPAEREELRESVDEHGNPIREVIRVATFPELYPMERLDNLRVSPRYNIDYMNEIATGEHARFELAKMQPLPDVLPEFEKIIMSVDVAWTQNRDSDFSVITTQAVDADNNYYVLDLIRSRFTLDNLALNISRAYHANGTRFGTIQKILIEDIGLQAMSLMKGLDKILPAEARKLDKGNKESRSTKLQGIISGGKFYYDQASDWGLGLKAEMAEFPNGKHDDQVDSLTLGVNYLYAYKKPLKAEVRMLTF